METPPSIFRRIFLDIANTQRIAALQKRNEQKKETSEQLAALHCGYDTANGSYRLRHTEQIQAGELLLTVLGYQTAYFRFLPQWSVARKERKRFIAASIPQTVATDYAFTSTAMRSAFPVSASFAFSSGPPSNRTAL